MCKGFHHCIGCGDTSPCEGRLYNNDSFFSNPNCHIPDVALCEKHQNMTEEEQRLAILRESEPDEFGDLD